MPPPDPPPPSLEPVPDPEPLPLPVGDKDGAGENLPVPVEEPEVPFGEPPFAAVPLPLTGPVAYEPDLVPPLGTGTWNDVVGFVVALGVAGGFNDGFAVGGFGFAGCDAFGAGASVVVF